MSPRSLVRCSLALPLVLTSFACKRTSTDVSSSAAPLDARADVVADTDAEPVHDDVLPSHIMLLWGTELFSAPSDDAYAMTLLDPGEGSGRAVAVIDQRDGWWQIETVTGSDVEPFGARAIEGLDFYRLQLYVPARTGWALREIPPGPEAPGSTAPASEEGSLGSPAADEETEALDEARQQAMESGLLAALSSSAMFDPPLQSGYRPPDATTDWRVSPSATVFWPDGRPAGEVRTEHAFAHPGVSNEHGDLLCFDIGIGPIGDAGGQLCFASTSVREAEVMYPGGLFGSGLAETDPWGGLVGAELGDEIGDAYGVGGLGLTGTGVGGGGAADVSIGGVGTIGRGGGGGSGSGYGVGSGTLHSGPTVTTSKPTVTKSMDADIARRIIRAHVDEVRSCWAFEKPSDASTGRVTLKLDVDSKGDVGKAKAKPDDKAQDAVARCIEKAAADWLFPSDMAGSIELSFDFAL